MDTKNIHLDALWYSSYESSDQGKALIICQQKKIQQLVLFLENIKGEIEMTEDPREISCAQAIESIKALINNIPKVEHIEGYFKWVG